MDARAAIRLAFVTTTRLPFCQQRELAIMMTMARSISNRHRLHVHANIYRKVHLFRIHHLPLLLLPVLPLVVQTLPQPLTLPQTQQTQ